MEAKDGGGADLPLEKDENLRRELMILFKNLRAQAISNMEYYQNETGANNERFHSSFSLLYEHLDRGIEPGIEYLLQIVHQYDFDRNIPANGYRSMIQTINKCCIKILNLARYITVNRESFLFRSGHYSREIEAYVTTIGQLRACLYYLQKLLVHCKEGVLFPDPEATSNDNSEFESAESLMMEFESLSQETFYGRCLGFQFCDSMVKPLSTIILAMASYGDGYEQDSTIMKFASSLLGGSRYILDPEQRAQKVVNMTRNGDVHFCKSFWHIAETDLLHQLPLFVCPSVEVDKVIVIQPETFEMLTGDKSAYVKVTPPCAHSGPGPVNTRLISYLLREGQEIWKVRPSPTKPTAEGTTNNTSAAPPKAYRKSPCLLMQCHGGGFVAQSSASQQSYLRSWARDLRIPILCIDYSLAPEHPFPRQLEEIVYAVCWARKNAHLLGWTGEKIGICGDSAGGNLALTVTMRLIAMGLEAPDAVLSMYGCMLVHYIPSPSRMMTLMDPLLPIGIMANCLAAYSGMEKEAMVTFPFDAMRSPATVTTPGGNSKDGNTVKSPGGGVAKKDSIKEEEDETAQKGANVEMDSHPKLRHRSNVSNRSTDSGFVDRGDLKNTHGYSSGADCYSSPEEVSSPDYGPSPEFSSPENSRMSESLNSLEEKSPSPEHQSLYKEALGRPDRSGMRLDFHESTPKRDRHLPKSPSLPVFHSLSYAHPSHSDMSIGGPFRSPPAYAQIRHFAQSPVVQFRHLPIAKNPFMSPYLAPDELLKKLPPVYLVACHLDPFLDDSVMMAKKLKSLNKEVHVDVLEDLPHGFLSFTLVSRDARQAANLCVQRVRDMLKLDTVDWSEFEILDKEDLAGYGDSPQ